MPTQVEDTLESSGISGSGLYAADSTWVKGDKISESPVHDDNEEILRLSVAGFNFSRSRRRDWEEDIVILRAGHRKVAIHLLDIEHNLPDRGEGRSYVVQSSFHDFSTDHIGL